MKYSFVCATLAAAAIATPYVNIEVGQEGLTEPNNGFKQSGWLSMLRPGRSRSRHERSRSRVRHGRGHDRSRSRHHRYEVDSIIAEKAGSLYECILKVLSNPSEFAECYSREQREVGDELDDRENDVEQGNNHGKHRHHHHHHNHRGHRHHRHQMEEQFFLDILSGHHKGHHHHRNHYECRVDLDDDMRRDQIARQCCEQEADGRYSQDDQTCRIKQRQELEEFQRCAMDQAAQNAECKRESLTVGGDMEL